jgi:hypothetical protein
MSFYVACFFQWFRTAMMGRCHHLIGSRRSQGQELRRLGILTVIVAKVKTGLHGARFTGSTNDEGASHEER